MRERHKSYRERYFENYQAVRTPSPGGTRVQYRYTGLWVRWESGRKPMRRVKLDMAILEVASVVIYVLASLSGTPLTRSRLCNGFGVLSLVPWLMELGGVIRFVASRAYAKEPSADEIGRSIRIGCSLRFLLAVFSALAGGVQTLVQGGAALSDLPAFLGICLSAMMSLLVRRTYGRLLVISYRNENGLPGSRI